VVVSHTLRLLQVDGLDAWFVEDTSTLWSEPTLMICFYRVTRTEAREALRDGMLLRQRDGFPGEFQAGIGTWIYVDPKAQPERSESKPIPPPKLKRGQLESRWYQGAWQVRTDRKGWR
jgi:hypothetical protein